MSKGFGILWHYTITLLIWPVRPHSHWKCDLEGNVASETGLQDPCRIPQRFS
jgi:hypothetical protein